jgi:uncharacterized membrane protein YjjP (DUF1212 family)
VNELLRKNVIVVVRAGLLCAGVALMVNAGRDTTALVFSVLFLAGFNFLCEVRDL